MAARFLNEHSHFLLALMILPLLLLLLLLQLASKQAAVWSDASKLKNLLLQKQLAPLYSLVSWVYSLWHCSYFYPRAKRKKESGGGQVGEEGGLLLLLPEENSDFLGGNLEAGLVRKIGQKRFPVQKG